MRRGDIIKSINGIKIITYEDLPREVSKLKPGTEISLVILRESKEINIQIILGDIPEPKGTQSLNSNKGAKKFGIIVNQIPDSQDKEKTKIIVSNVARSSDNTKFFLKGDIILEINRQPVTDIDSFNSAMKNIKSGQNCLFLIQRQSKDSEVTLYKSIKSN